MKNKILGLLHWSEKYTRTDMVYLTKGGFWTILGQMISIFLTFLLAIAFAHYISKETYGQYKFVLSLASIFGTFTLTGLGTAVLHSVSRGFEGTLKYAFWKNIRWSILFWILSLGAAGYYFLNNNAVLGIAMLFVGSLSPFLQSTNLYNSYLTAKKDFKRSAIYFSVLGSLVPAICLFITLLLSSNLTALVAVYFLSNVLIGVILYARTIQIYKPHGEIDKESLDYGKHLSFLGILSGIAGNIDQVLVFHYIGAVELAIYNFAIALPKQIKGPVKGFASLIFPKFSERSDSEIRRGMKSKVILLFIASIVIIVSYIIVAPYIFKIFFPKYMDSVFYSQVFSLSLLWIASIPTETYLAAKKKIKAQYVNNIVVSVLQIIFLIIGISVAGLLGLIIARIATSVASTAMSIFLFEKSSRTIL